MTSLAIIATSTSWCTTCRADMAFEQPACIDDHGHDCPDWACVGCGEAIVVGFGCTETLVQAAPTSHVA
jgi:hypothetical protein